MLARYGSSCCSIVLLFVYRHGDRRNLHSFPTRRSSDLAPPSRAVLTSSARSRRCTSAPARTRSRCRATSLAASRSVAVRSRSEEHTSELQSREKLVCRLLLEKKNKSGHDVWKERDNVVQ